MSSSHNNVDPFHGATARQLSYSYDDAVLIVKPDFYIMIGPINDNAL